MAIRLEWANSPCRAGLRRRWRLRGRGRGRPCGCCGTRPADRAGNGRGAARRSCSQGQLRQGDEAWGWSSSGSSAGHLLAGQGQPASRIGRGKFSFEPSTENSDRARIADCRFQLTGTVPPAICRMSTALGLHLAIVSISGRWSAKRSNAYFGRRNTGLMFEIRSS